RGFGAEYCHRALRGLRRYHLDHCPRPQTRSAHCHGAWRGGYRAASRAARLMPTAWLSLGANIGDPPAQLAEAIRRLDAHAQIRLASRSAIIRTKAWGKTDQPDFANMAAAVETDL